MQKKLNLFDLTSIGVGCIVGSGIFALLGVGIAYTGRGIVIALFLAMFRYKGGNYTMTASTLGPLAGGIYALWWLPMFLSRGTAASALGQYLNSVFPQISVKWSAVVLTTIVFIVNLFGVKAMSKLQRPLMAVAAGALMIFTLFGLPQLQPGSFQVAKSAYYSGGGVGLLLAITLVIQPTSAPSLLCGFSWEAQNSKRNIPIAILVGSGIIFLVFVSVSFVASNAIAVEDMAGKTMTYAARKLLPGIVCSLFLFFGPVLALCSSLNASMGSIAAPVLGAIRDGWIPESVGGTNRFESPWIVYTVMWLFCIVPIILGVSLKTFIAYTVMTQRICGLLMLIVAFRLPQKFQQQWESSFLHMPNSLYYILVGMSGLTEIATLAASILATSMSIFIGNLILVGGLAAYACYRFKSGKTHVNILMEV